MIRFYLIVVQRYNEKEKQSGIEISILGSLITF